VTRYFEASLLLSSVWFLNHTLNRNLFFSLFGLGSVLATTAILYGYFPVTYIDGEGLTAFKIYSEYAIMGVLLLAAYILTRNRQLIDCYIYRLMIASILLTVAAELCFTLYADLYSGMLTAGHIFKFFSYWLIFLAVVRTTLRDPYKAMARVSSTYDAIPSPTVVVDANGFIRQINKAACQVAGRDARDILERHCHELFHPRSIDTNDCVVCHHIRLGQPLSGYDMECTDEGTWREYSLARLETPGEVPGMVQVFPDITDRKKAQDDLFRQANYDALTGLPNRVLATDRLQQSIRNAARSGKHVAVVFIDIDNFKHINDTLGHVFGDRILVKVSEYLAHCMRDSDTVARWGGDEFLVITPELQSLDQVEVVVEKIIEELGHPIVIDGREFTTTASLGITGYPDDAENVDELLSHADTAMYQAKSAGKNTYRFYTPDMNVKVSRHLEIEAALRYAIERNELALYYQPMIELGSGKVFGAEALLRWNSSTLGTVPPDQFIPLAEETGLIFSIGNWVIDTACRDAARWLAEGFPDVRIAINISSRQIRRGDFPDIMRDTLRKYRLAPETVMIEITESLLLDENEDNIRTLDELSRSGLSLSLDDFGTGYSSLSYLKRFPFDEVKIDRSFVRDITTDESDAALCRAIIAMAQSLNLTVIGEGVETREQLDFLTKHGAHYVQGYYFSPAITAEEFLAYLRQANAQPLERSGRTTQG
jgi:diguanylate cyclase (GGDEF)-like protein/PAS domain S-box-containing protein